MLATDTRGFRVHHHRLPSVSGLCLRSMRLTAAEGLLIPIQCEYYALEGLSKLLDSVRLVRAHLNPELEVFGVVMTMYDSRTKLCHSRS